MRLAIAPLGEVWASSWQADADTLIGPKVGLPPLGFVALGRPDITTSRPCGYLWKRDPVSAWLGDRPAAWIGDDFTRLDHAWAARGNADGIPTLIVQPDPRIGLPQNTSWPFASEALTVASTPSRRGLAVPDERSPGRQAPHRMISALRQAGAWLAVDLVQLREDDVIIARRGGKYVHSRGDAEYLLIETSSNVDLVGDLRLSAEDEAALRVRGWLPPVPGVPGWFCRASSPGRSLVRRR
jgi:hypothetical protein